MYSLLTILMAVLTSLSGATANYTEVANVRYDNATVIECVYDADADVCVTTLVSSDGNEWVIDDFKAPLGDECIVEFDTLGTKEVEDDEISHVILVHEVVR